MDYDQSTENRAEVKFGNKLLKDSVMKAKRKRVEDDDDIDNDEDLGNVSNTKEQNDSVSKKRTGALVSYQRPISPEEDVATQFVRQAKNPLTASSGKKARKSLRLDRTTDDLDEHSNSNGKIAKQPTERLFGRPLLKRKQVSFNSLKR